MKIAIIIQFLVCNKAIREALYETIDFLIKRGRLKNDADGLTDEDKTVLKSEKYDIANAFLKLLKTEK